MWAFVTKYITDPCIKSVIIDDEKGEVSIFELENGDHRVIFRGREIVKNGVISKPIPVEEIIKHHKTITNEDGIGLLETLQQFGASSASIFVNEKLMSFRLSGGERHKGYGANQYVKHYMCDPCVMHVEVGDVKISRIKEDFEVEMDDTKYLVRKPPVVETKKDGLELMKKYKDAKMLKLKTKDWELNFNH